MSLETPAFYPDTRFEIRVGIANASEVEAARNPILTINIPDGISILQWNSDDGSQCEHQPGKMVCRLRDIGQWHSPEFYRSIEFTGVAKTSGDFAIEAIASSDNVNPITDFNTAILPVSVIDWSELVELELQIDSQMQAKSLAFGDKEVFSVRIINNHQSNTSRETYLHLFEPSNLSIKLVNGCEQSHFEGWTNQGIRHACEIGDIGPGQSSEVSLEVTPKLQNDSKWAQFQNISLNVFSSRHDYHESNNDARIIASIYPSGAITQPPVITAPDDSIDLQLDITGTEEIETLVTGDTVPLAIEVKNNHTLNTATAPIIFYGSNYVVYVDFEDSCKEWYANNSTPRSTTYTCELEDIPPQSSIVINAQATATGTSYRNIWPETMGFFPYIYANEIDHDDSNNEAQKLFAVLQDPATAASAAAPEPPIRPAIAENGGGSASKFLLLWILVLAKLQLRSKARLRVARYVYRPTCIKCRPAVPVSADSARCFWSV